MFSAAGNEADHPCIVFKITNESASNAFFRHALRFLLLCPYLYDCGAIALNPGFTSGLWFFVRVDVFNMDFWREVRVLVEQIFCLMKACRLIEVGDGRVLLQPFHNLRRLVR